MRRCLIDDARKQRSRPEAEKKPGNRSSRKQCTRSAKHHPQLTAGFRFNRSIGERREKSAWTSLDRTALLPCGRHASVPLIH